MHISVQHTEELTTFLNMDPSNMKIYVKTSNLWWKGSYEVSC